LLRFGGKKKGGNSLVGMDSGGKRINESALFQLKKRAGGGVSRDKPSV